MPMLSTFVVSTSATSEEDTISGSEITSYGTRSAVFALKHITKSYIASYITFAPSAHFIKDCIASSVTYTAFTIIQKNENVTTACIAVNAVRSCVKTVVYKISTIEHDISPYYTGPIVATLNGFLEDFICEFDIPTASIEINKDLFSMRNLSNNDLFPIKNIFNTSTKLAGNISYFYGDFFVFMKCSSSTEVGCINNKLHFTGDCFFIQEENQYDCADENDKSHNDLNDFNCTYVYTFHPAFNTIYADQ